MPRSSKKVGNAAATLAKGIVMTQKPRPLRELSEGFVGWTRSWCNRTKSVG